MHKIHGIDDSGKVTKYNHSPAGEESVLEAHIEKDPEIIEKGMMILNRQHKTDDGDRVDLLGLDYAGNAVVFELKQLGNNARRVITQTIEYGIWAEELGYSDLNLIAKDQKKLGKYHSLDELFRDRTNEMEPEDYNNNTKMYIVHEKISDDVKKIAKWLNKKGINIHCVELNFHEANGHTIAARHDIVGGVKSTGKEKGEVPESEHTTRGSPETRELYELLKQKVMGWKNVTMRPVLNYVGFKGTEKKNFVSVKFRQSFLKLHIRQKYGKGKECFTDENDITQATHWAGVRECKVKDKEKLEQIMEFIKQSYDGQKRI